MAPEEATIVQDVRRGGWRRPHVHHSRSEVVGFVLWWLVVSVFATATVIILIRQP